MNKGMNRLSLLVIMLVIYSFILKLNAECLRERVLADFIYESQQVDTVCVHRIIEGIDSVFYYVGFNNTAGDLLLNNIIVTEGTFFTLHDTVKSKFKKDSQFLIAE